MFVVVANSFDQIKWCNYLNCSKKATYVHHSPFTIVDVLVQTTTVNQLIYYFIFAYLIHWNLFVALIPSVLYRFFCCCCIFLLSENSRWSVTCSKMRKNESNLYLALKSTAHNVNKMKRRIKTAKVSVHRFLVMVYLEYKRIVSDQSRRNSILYRKINNNYKVCRCR